MLIENFFVNFQKSSFLTTSVPMGLQIAINEERNECDLELEIVDININFVLDSIDPSFIKSTEMIGELLNNMVVSWMFSEVGPWVISITVDILYWKDWFLPWKILFVLGSSWLWLLLSFGFSFGFSFGSLIVGSQVWFCVFSFNFIVFGYKICEVSVLEPLGESIEVKSKVVNSSFPSFQASNQWGRSDDSPVVSGDWFNSQGNSWDLIGSAQLYNTVWWTIVWGFFVIAGLFGTNFSFSLLLNWLLSLLSCGFVVVLDWREKSKWLWAIQKFKEIDSWRTIDGVLASSNGVSYVLRIEEGKLLISKTV